MGYVNGTAMYDQKKVRKYGKLYGSIDFEVSDTISAHYFERTMTTAKEVVNRKHKLGMMR